jgi:hypothetical protein
MTLKELARQHEKFAAAQARKAERAAAKERKAHVWRVIQEQFRKRREAKERKADLRLQQRLEEDPRYFD